MKVKCISNSLDCPHLTIGKTYDILYIIEDFIKIIDDSDSMLYCPRHLFEEVKEMEKEKVLEIEFQDVFDMVAWKVTYQNEEILDRKFKDYDLGVQTDDIPEYYGEILWLRGTNRKYDDRIDFCTKEDAEIIKQKVEAINEKYGIPKRWRADIGDDYYYFNKDLEIICFTEFEDDTDDRLYKLGNYFKTRDEALDAAEKIKELLKNKEQKYE